MLLSSRDHVVFHTSESGGDDLCITDSLGRYTLVNVDDLDTIINMLMEAKHTTTFYIDEIDPRNYVDDD